MNADELSSRVFSRLAATAGARSVDDHFAVDRWEWPQGVALYALAKRHEDRGQPADLGFLLSWYGRAMASGGAPVRNVNTTAPLLGLLSLPAAALRKEWRDYCLDWAEWIMRDMPRTEEGGIQHVTSHLVNPGELWADTLFMTVLFLARAGLVFGRKDMLEEAAYQFLLHIRHLEDGEAGLWFHGWTFEGRHHFGRVHWARGNAWFSIAAMEFLAMCDPGVAVRRTVTEAFRSQMRTLAGLQAEDGLWHTILDDPASYTETSASAAVAHAMRLGIGSGLLGGEFRPIMERAERGVIGRIAPDGAVGGVSHGTALGMDAAHYLGIPVSPTAYGQGLAFLMLAGIDPRKEL